MAIKPLAREINDWTKNQTQQTFYNNVIFEYSNFFLVNQFLFEEISVGVHYIPLGN